MRAHKPRDPQLNLQLGLALPDPADRWCDGACFAYLGGDLSLQLATPYLSAQREGQVLHLPLPPGASARQIQDGVETWLRQEAARVITDIVTQTTQQEALPAPQWALSFAARSAWAQVQEDGSLRFNWRLIEQAPTVIEQIVTRALADLPRPQMAADLWPTQVT